jgi:hypothetical protein
MRQQKRKMSESGKVECYLRELSRVCAVVIREPRLLPVLIGILRLVPQTLMELRRVDRRLAA